MVGEIANVSTGEPIQLYGAGFAGSSQVTVDVLDHRHKTSRATAETDANGTFTISLVPTGYSGLRTVLATQKDGNRLLGSAALFTIPLDDKMPGQRDERH